MNFNNWRGILDRDLAGRQYAVFSAMGTDQMTEPMSFNEAWDKLDKLCRTGISCHLTVKRVE